MSTIHPDYMHYFSKQAEQYQAYRPSYPQALFDYLLSLTSEHTCAWDVGTGNGQAAIVLSEHFNKVIATDLQQASLDVAPLRNNIAYIACPAEATPIQSDSVDLITVAQALHWFQLDKFYEEVSRVLKPKGILSAWCYTLASITPEIDACTERLYSHILGDTYWPKERHYIDDVYQTIPFPSPRIETPSFCIERSLNLAQWLGYLNTWSAVKAYAAKNNGSNPIDLIHDELIRVWGKPQQARLTKTPLYLLAARLK